MKRLASLRHALQLKPMLVLLEAMHQQPGLLLQVIHPPLGLLGLLMEVMQQQLGLRGLLLEVMHQQHQQRGLLGLLLEVTR